MRKSGVLLPVASLPSDYGIGGFSKEAYRFIEQLEEAGQSYWQILPMGPTGYGDSPYQSFSTFAGNSYFIDLEELQSRGWVTKEECDACDFGDNIHEIDYYKLYRSREKVLRTAYENSNIKECKAFTEFCDKEQAWLDDYCLYMVVKASFGGKSWIEWDTDIRFRKAEAMRKYSISYEDEIVFYKFQQFIFMEQWEQLKEYANEKNIEIIGDIPIYVALDSADTWAAPELFQLDEERLPTAVAGCPPDGFSRTGQLWGNPLYDWAYHENNDYTWWMKRILHHQRLYDIIRIDHFRGFDAYYSIPYGSETAEYGEWKTGPGIAFFKVLWERLGEVEIIAEDLGFLTESVCNLLAESGYPGMKVLQFAFDSREDGNYLPHNYTPNSVVYTGTHDNNTTKAWYQNLADKDKEFALEYLGRNTKSADEITWALIQMAQGSVASRCIIPLQDYLLFGEETRINTPSTLGGNWTWRMDKDDLTEELIMRMRQMTKLYGRIRK
jgi:4-alpha-glucanotransferase